MNYPFFSIKKIAFLASCLLTSCLSQLSLAVVIDDMISKSKFWPSKPEEVQKFYENDQFCWLNKDKTHLFLNNSSSIKFTKEDRWKIDSMDIQFYKNQVSSVCLLIKNPQLSLEKIYQGIEDLRPNKGKTTKIGKANIITEDPFISLSRSFYFWKITSSTVIYLENIENAGTGATCYCCLEAVTRNNTIQYYKIHFIKPSRLFSFYQKAEKSHISPPPQDPQDFKKYINKEDKENALIISKLPMVIAQDNSTQATCLATLSRLCHYYGFPISIQDLTIAFSSSSSNWIENTWLPLMNKFSSLLHADFISVKGLDAFSEENILHNFVNPYNERMRSNIRKKTGPKTSIKNYEGKSFDDIMIQFDKKTLADVRINETEQKKLFIDVVKNNIRNGFPLIWIVQNQLNPEYKRGVQPDAVRLIIGFGFETKPKTKDAEFYIIYTSPVGFKKEGKKSSLDDQYTLNVNDAVSVTKGLFQLTPLEIKKVDVEENKKTSNN